MIFQRHKPTVVDLTNEAYSRWLRAGRPQPVAWFLGLHPEEQEQLGLLGDQYQQDLCLAIGYAVANPVLADAGLDAADNPESEEVLLRQMAAKTAARLLGVDGKARLSQAATGRTESISMGGITERQQARSEATRKAKDMARSFLGREPDGVRA